MKTSTLKKIRIYILKLLAQKLPATMQAIIKCYNHII